jgi:hypothetical protein
VNTRRPQSPSWANRPYEPADLPSLLEWLEQAAKPHRAILSPDRCVVSGSATNTGESKIHGATVSKVRVNAAELLWDETCRACDWLHDNSYRDAPVRPPKPVDHLAQAEDELSKTNLGERLTAGARQVDVFKKSRAWNTMIVSGTTKGTVRLQKPS